MGQHASPSQQQTSQQAAILDALTEGVFTVDNDFRITSLNAAAEEITGVQRRDAIGMPCRSLFRASVCDGACALAETLRTGEPIHCRNATILDADGQTVPVSISTNILRDEQGRIIGGVETFRDLSQIEHLRRELQGTWRLGDLVARSPVMHELFRLVPIVADSTATVLIQGESGTGKELIARAVHHESPRRGRPFVAVNCGALPDNLLESELFGYKKGAFTDARSDKPGRFRLAEGGTLFLDEIGDISPAMQVRLLRVLQERTYEPLGATRSERADVRIIAATHRDLAVEIVDGDFRPDLYYRLNVVQLTLPPLRERSEDIPLLIEHFLDRHGVREGRRPSTMSDDALALLMRHDFPGNVRELENIVERACVWCRSGPITLAHLPPAIQALVDHAPTSTGNPLADAEAAALLRSLEAHGWNRQATAQSLGIHKTTLLRKLKRLGLTPPVFPSVSASRK